MPMMMMMIGHSTSSVRNCSGNQNNIFFAREFRTPCFGWRLVCLSLWCNRFSVRTRKIRKKTTDCYLSLVRFLGQVGDDLPQAPSQSPSRYQEY
jgi:hypothetical protein